MPEPASLKQILDEVGNWLGDVFDQIRWAEEEIVAAQRRHPSMVDVLWHCFPLLSTDGNNKLGRELLFRAHCRELLDRVAAGESTVKGTAAEVITATMATSLVAPLNSTAFGLYLRMWNTAGLPSIEATTGQQDHYEAIARSSIDDFEAHSRRWLSRPDRVLGEPDCSGKHHGSPVACRFAAADNGQAA
jgi:hypothetical protein